MAGKDEISIAEITPRGKKDFLNDCFQKHKELNKYQREYKKVLSKRLVKRSERILEQSYLQTIESLQNERNELRAQIWVANGQPQFDEDKQRLQQIQCHVECQEHLSSQIKNLKVAIRNIEYQKSITDKQIYELNRKTVPDSQHEVFVKRARKRLSILENQLEVGVRRECKITAINAEQREEMKAMLNQRDQFNATYTALVQRLNADKKYMMDLLEYATNAYEGGIDISEKIAHTKRKAAKECEQTKVMVQSVMRNMAGAELVNGFHSCKNYSRRLADLQPFEYRRREAFKRRHVHHIQLYNNVIAKILKYFETQNIHAVIDKYRHQQSLYYSYFTYANETSYHITFLETAVDRLFTNVRKTNIENRTKRLEDIERFDELEAKLKECQQRNQELNSQVVDTERQFEDLLGGVKSVFDACLADNRPLLELLGNQNYVNLHNMHGYLRILERRILDIVRSVYIMERTNFNKKPVDFIVKDLDKYHEPPTDLNDIVLTQQCPECAEGETFNMDEAGDAGVAVTSIAEAKKKLFETVNQPDMQYRLHSISLCRLPRSRLLAAKRNA